MQPTDTILPISKAPSLLSRVIHFLASTRNSTVATNRIPGNIDWADSDSDPGQLHGGRYERPVSGGYNEAYIVQHWTSYHLR